jgi:hypothetical protein
MFSSLVLLFGAGLSCHAENEEAVKAFGIQKNKPLNSGFLFWNYQYVAAPYVLERRGLDVYINGILMMPGANWPQEEKKVTDDPGDPPPGCSPWNDPQNYVAHKWRYLSDQYETEKALRLMVEVLKKFSDVKEVKWKDGSESVDVRNAKGEELGFWLNRVKPRAKEDVLESATSEAEIYKRSLKGNGMVWRGDSIPQVGMGKDNALKVIGIILSKASPEEKIKQAEAGKLVIVPEIRRLVADCIPTEQLRQRYEELMSGKVEEEEVEPPDWIAQAQEKSRMIAAGLPPTITHRTGSRLFLWLGGGSALLALILAFLGWRLRPK